MAPIPLAELERRCQKPEHRRVGNWMARRISRPAALRVTCIVAVWGISANVATLAAWAMAVGAAAAFGWGSTAGWLLGAALLQLWYLLDHVDGQLARFHGTASLDGVQLDYLMHHTVNLLIPLGVGYGLFVRSAEPRWLLGGLVWGVSLLLIGLVHDARYKAFIQRLKRVRGRLEVVGGGGGRPQAQPPMPRRPRALAVWTLRKVCEMHVVMNVLSALSVLQWLASDTDMVVGRVWLALVAPAAVLLASATLVRSQSRHAAEAEFAAWFRAAPPCDLVFREGWWIVEEAEDRQAGGDCPTPPQWPKRPS